jgi:hypothetical protein
MSETKEAKHNGHPLRSQAMEAESPRAKARREAREREVAAERERKGA